MTFWAGLWKLSSMVEQAARLHWDDQVEKHPDRLQNRKIRTPWRFDPRRPWPCSLHRCKTPTSTQSVSKCEAWCTLSRTKTALVSRWPLFLAWSCRIREDWQRVRPFWWPGWEAWKAESLWPDELSSRLSKLVQQGAACYLANEACKKAPEHLPSTNHRSAWWRKRSSFASFSPI